MVYSIFYRKNIELAIQKCGTNNSKMLNQCIENVEQYFENVEPQHFFLSSSPITAAGTGGGGGAAGARHVEEAEAPRAAAGEAAALRAHSARATAGEEAARRQAAAAAP